MITIQTKSEKQTEKAAALMAGVWPKRCLVFLKGDLGAGKTAFARGVANGLGIKANVSSPTFTLVNEYQTGDARLVHMDLYRVLGQPMEDLGLDEYFMQPGVCLVEWPDDLEKWEEPDVTVQIEYRGAEERLISVRAEIELEEKMQEALACEF